MTKSRIFIMLGVCFCVLCMGGLVSQVNEAAAQVSQCKSPFDPNNYKTCADCLPPCHPDVTNPGGKVTVADSQAILKCSKTPTCKGPAPNLQTKYDLNGDGVVNNTDYNIAVRCLGCSETSSPFQ